MATGQGDKTRALDAINCFCEKNLNLTHMSQETDIKETKKSLIM